MKICTSLLNKHFPPLKVSSMILSLHKNYQVKSEKRWVKIRKTLRKGNETKIVNKLEECIFIDLTDSLDYMSQVVLQKNDSFTAVRKEWLKMLKFAKRNHEKLAELYIVNKEDVA